MVTACDVSTTDQDESQPVPSARSRADGVEVWDLTGKPSAEAFGLEGNRLDRSYESEQPRRVRFDLPDGTHLTLDAVLVSFTHIGDDGDPDFTVGIRTAQLEPDALVATFRSVLEQLDVRTGAADDLASRIVAAPDDQTERISVGSDVATLGGLAIGAQAGLAPIAGSGRVIVGGSWR
jgi:hypothetical protein